MRKWARISRSVLLLALYVAISDYLMLVVNNRVSNIVLAIPFLFVVPGATALIALKPKVSEIRGTSYTLWVVLGSMAISVIVGLLLNSVGTLNRRDWVVSITVIVGVLALLGMIRANSLGNFGIGSVKLPPMKLRWGREILSGIAFLLIIASSLVISIVSTNRHEEHFAQLWLVPIASGASSQTSKAQLGVRNFEGTKARFALSLYENNVINVKVIRKSITLRNGGTWSLDVNRGIHVNLRAVLEFRGVSGLQKQYVNLESPPGSCNPVNASSTLEFTYKPDDEGTYHFAALGLVSNSSASNLQNVEVAVVITYADGSRSTVLAGYVHEGTIRPSSTGRWGIAFTTTDGKVVPTAAHVVEIFSCQHS